MNKTSIPNPGPDLLKALEIWSDTTVRRSAVDWEDLKPYCKSVFFKYCKKGHIFLGDQESYYLSY